VKTCQRGESPGGGKGGRCLHGTLPPCTAKREWASLCERKKKNPGAGKKKGLKKRAKLSGHGSGPEKHFRPAKSTASSQKSTGKKGDLRAGGKKKGNYSTREKSAHYGGRCCPANKKEARKKPERRGSSTKGEREDEGPDSEKRPGLRQRHGGGGGTRQKGGSSTTLSAGEEKRGKPDTVRKKKAKSRRERGRWLKWGKGRMKERHHGIAAGGTSFEESSLHRREGDGRQNQRGTGGIWKLNQRSESSAAQGKNKEILLWKISPAQRDIGLPGGEKNRHEENRAKLGEGGDHHPGRSRSSGKKSDSAY